MISIRCPSCGREHEFTDTLAGLRIACKGCSGWLQLPGCGTAPADHANAACHKKAPTRVAPPPLRSTITNASPASGEDLLAAVRPTLGKQSDVHGQLAKDLDQPECSKVYHLHSRARLAFFLAGLAGVLFASFGLLMVFRSPIALIFLVGGLIGAFCYFSALTGSQLVIDRNVLLAECIVRKRIDLASIVRLGLFQATSFHFMHRLMYGGSEGTVLWIMDRAGNTTKMHVYMYENADNFLRRLHEQVQLDYETITAGLFGAGWPS